MSVRFASGRHPCQRIVTTQPCQGWLSPDNTHTHGLWNHDTRPISFSLVEDDLGVKYVGREHAEHFMTFIRKNYNISSDWNGGAYWGITFDWYYKITQSIYLYQDTSKMHSINTNILPQHAQKTHHTHGIHAFMTPKRNL
jgi:hypothetical protein